MGSDPLAIPVKKGEKFSFGAAFEGEQLKKKKTVFILFSWLMFNL